MGTRGLPDIYTRSPRAAGPRAEGVYIRQTTSAHGITIMYHFRTLSCVGEHQAAQTSVISDVAYL